MISTTTHPATKHQFEFLRLGHNRWPIVFDERGRTTQGESTNAMYCWQEDGDLVLANEKATRRIASPEQEVIGRDNLYTLRRSPASR